MYADVALGCHLHIYYNDIPYFRAYAPLVIHFFACQKEVFRVIQGCGVCKIIFTRFVYHVGFGIFSTLLAAFN